MKFIKLLTALLFIQISVFSQGENCDSALEIVLNDTYTSDGPSTGDGCFTCPGDAINADWFKFTPTENTSISISS
ncbi:MAG: hypothetical protein ACI86P_001903, partial [Flavobacteriales bacterium]